MDFHDQTRAGNIQNTHVPTRTRYSFSAELETFSRTCSEAASLKIKILDFAIFREDDKSCLRILEETFMANRESKAY